MTVSRDKVSEIIEFFDMTGRKCIVIWERTVPEAKHPTVEVSASVKDGYGDFFRAAGKILHRAASDIDSGDLKDLDEEDDEATDQ